jgi:hypothetical protein
MGMKPCNMYTLGFQMFEQPRPVESSPCAEDLEGYGRGTICGLIRTKVRVERVYGEGRIVRRSGKGMCFRGLWMEERQNGPASLKALV